MDVLVTGAHGRVGTAIADGLADRDGYDFTYLDVEDHPDRPTVVADVADYEAIRLAFDGKDAVIDLAYRFSPGITATDGEVAWSEPFAANLEGTCNVVAAALDAGVERVVYASSNHAVGTYEVENAPDVYYPGFGLAVDHTVPSRPDSMYGVTKVYGEALGRFTAEAHGVRFYALRIAAVRGPEYDHPYGDAERGVDRGDWEHGSDAYDEQVARMKAMWLSRRDLAHLVDRCLRDETVGFGVFYGVSDNDRRWFDIDHARDVLGYEPKDDAEEWDAPPETAG